MSDRRLPAEREPSSTPKFCGGVESRRPTPKNLERAHRATARSYRDRRLAEKLDALLGSVDQDLPPIEGDAS